MTDPTPEQISRVMRHISLKADPKNKVRKLPRKHFVRMAKNSHKNRGKAKSEAANTGG